MIPRLGRRLFSPKNGVFSRYKVDALINRAYEIYRMAGMSRVQSSNNYSGETRRKPTKFSLKVEKKASSSSKEFGSDFLADEMLSSSKLSLQNLSKKLNTNRSLLKPTGSKPVKKPVAPSKRKEKAKTPVLYELPYPPVMTVPDMPLRHPLPPHDENSTRFFKDLDRASNYLDRVRIVSRLEALQQASGVTPEDAKVFRVALKLHVNVDMLKHEYEEIKSIVGVGEGASIKEAKQVARMDLAERLYQLHRNPIPCLGKKEAKKVEEAETKFVPFALSDNIRRMIKDTNRMVNETGVFGITTSSEVVDGEASHDGRDNSFDRDNAGPLPGRKFSQMCSETIKQTPAPDREASKLPIWNLYHQLIQTVESHNVTILSAATGSGKTTQLPQFILDHYMNSRSHYFRAPSIVVTQPRRLAAKSVAQRVSEERERAVPGTGPSVGYSVRFDSKPPVSQGDGTALFCTAGILLRRLQNDPNLRHVTHLILDEVHERDVFTDILLLVTLNLLKRRPDLRVILMSATMDAGKFVKYFQAEGYSVGSVLDIEGTNYPVQEHYLEDALQITDGNNSGWRPDTERYVKTETTVDLENGMDGIIIEDSYLEAIPFEVMASLVQHITENEGEGAILMFLPGWDEITEMHTILMSKLASHNVEYHLLHSTAPPGTSDAAFKRPPAGTRKVIMATNIAESSVTIPDVVFVIDSGKQKVMHYDQLLRMNVLENCWISKANLRQRLGRAGRCQAGKFYGMYSGKRARLLPDSTQPELLRLSLDEVCLNLKAMGFEQPSDVLLSAAIDPPKAVAVQSSIQRLKGLGAIDQDEGLTPLGRMLASIPIHPAMSKMLITSMIFGCLEPVLSTVAMLGQKLIRPARLPQEKYDLHTFYRLHGQDMRSDHLLMNKVFQSWKRNNYYFPRSIAQFESLFSRPTLRRLEEGRRQILKDVSRSFGIVPEDAEVNSDNDKLARLILTSGFYPEVAIAKKRRNTFVLRKIPLASVSSSSSMFKLGSSTIKETLESRNMRRDPYNVGSSSNSTCGEGAFFIYEELIDIGQKLISKITAVDPLSFVLFAERTRTRYYQDADGKSFEQLHIDGWVSLRAGENTEDLKLLRDLRGLWNDFVQFYIYKQLRGEALTADEQGAVAMLKRLILTFANESSTMRALVGDRSVEVEKAALLKRQQSGGGGAMGKFKHEMADFLTE